MSSSGVNTLRRVLRQTILSLTGQLIVYQYPMIRLITCLLALTLGTVAGQEVVLQAPLSTIVVAHGMAVVGEKRVSAVITVPADAPPDLGVAAFVRDRDGQWFQRRWPKPLTPGSHIISLTFTHDDQPQAEPVPLAWRTDDLERADRAGVVLWSATASRATIRIDHLVVAATRSGETPTPHLRDLHIDGLDDQGQAQVTCGQRWTVTTLPMPFPSNPTEPAEFTLDAVITGPDGERHIPCAYVQPMRTGDMGNHESAQPVGAGRFELRFRPSQPGVYRTTLRARWGDGRLVESSLPDLHAIGPAVDTLVRIDRDDPRFFSVGGAFWWPVGLNLHSTFDKRSQEVISTTLTPARGSLVYDAILPRCAAAGIDACEIWMSNWNVALEWRADWPGYRGLGRINQANAWRLDRILDSAWANGIRINLVINNHGQASPKADREWKDNPYNRLTGGFLEKPEELFTDPRALASQERLRRYIIARYADHPAILGWKLWSEVDLTAGKGEVLKRWFEQATASWKTLDSYGHACTAHWSGSYTKPDPAICALPGLEYLCIDAYRGVDPNGSWQSMAALLADSIHNPGRGLGKWRKPILVTEYGAWNKAPILNREVDLRVAAWSSLVSGHGGSAMTWWWEWIDQRELWGSYRAIRAFIAGEDLRNPAASSVFLGAQSGTSALWCRAWSHAGHLLGYLVDPTWATTGAEKSISDAVITIGKDIAAGTITLEWWDAELGSIISRHTIEHPGGTLILHVPTCTVHIAFKMQRTGMPTSE